MVNIGNAADVDEIFIFLLYLLSHTVGNEIPSKYITVFAAHSLTTHYLVRDRNAWNNSHDASKTLDMGLYGWSPARFNTTLVTFDTMSESDREVIASVAVRASMIVNYVSDSSLAGKSSNNEKLRELHQRYIEMYSRVTDNADMVMSNTSGGYRDVYKLNYRQFVNLISCLRGLELVHTVDLAMYLKKFKTAGSLNRGIDSYVADRLDILSPVRINNWRRWGNPFYVKK